MNKLVLKLGTLWCKIRGHHKMWLKVYVIRGFGMSYHNECKTCKVRAW